MPNHIPLETNINTEQAKLLIEDHFDFNVTSIEVLGEGWDNLVYLVNRELVFRFPRREIAVPLLQREIDVLGNISGAIGLNTPCPKFIATGSKQFNYPFYGHEMVSGNTGCKVDLTNEQQVAAAKKLAHALSALHQLPIDKIGLTENLEPTIDRLNFNSLCQFFYQRMSEIKGKFNLSEYDSEIKAIVDKASQYDRSRYPRVFVHGDLYFRHLLFEDNQLVGLIDWGDCCLSQKALDLGIAYQLFNDEARAVFWAHYLKTDEHERHLAQFIALYINIALLWYASGIDDQKLVSKTLQSIEKTIAADTHR